MRTHRTDEYLETIFKLQEKENPVRIITISNSLKLSPPTVSEMLKRLSEAKYITVSKSGVSLTRSGQSEAKKVIRRHRLSERFLTDILGLGLHEAHDEACKFEHILSDKVEESLAEKLGDPTTCPHGHPIPDKKGKIEKTAYVSLQKLKTGDKAVIKKIYEEDSGMIQYLASLGLLPETKIKIEEIAPFGGPMIIKIGKAKYAIGKTITSHIEVLKV